MILSERLKAVTNLLPDGNIVADIGCDHGYISISLVESGRYNRAIAMDVRKGPLSIAKENIEKSNLTNKIETRLSDGLDAITIGEADSAIIAGMGGLLVISILSKNLEKAKAMKYLVLQPQSDIDQVRRFLRENDLNIIAENMIKEDGKYYPMFLVKYEGAVNIEAVYNELILRSNDLSFASEISFTRDDILKTCDLYGPLLLRDGNAVLKEFLAHERDVYESVLQKLPENNISRIAEIELMIKYNKLAGALLV